MLRAIPVGDSSPFHCLRLRRMIVVCVTASLLAACGPRQLPDEIDGVWLAWLEREHVAVALLFRTDGKKLQGAFAAAETTQERPGGPETTPLYEMQSVEFSNGTLTFVSNAERGRQIRGTFRLENGKLVGAMGDGHKQDSLTFTRDAPQAKAVFEKCKMAPAAESGKQMDNKPQLTARSLLNSSWTFESSTLMFLPNNVLTVTTPGIPEIKGTWSLDGKTLNISVGAVKTAGAIDGDQIVLNGKSLQRSKGDDILVQCQDHLKQMGLVLKMFANESKGARFPNLSSEHGRLMCAQEQIHPEYLTDLKILDCPGDKEAGGPSNRHSYFYLGYTVGNDANVKAFAAAYRDAMVKGLKSAAGRKEAASELDDDIKVPTGTGSGGGDTLYRLREGIERFMITDINSPAASASAQAGIPVLIEWPGHHATPGGNVLFMDGHVEFIPYPGKWPMTTATMDTLASLTRP